MPAVVSSMPIAINGMRGRRAQQNLLAHVRSDLFDGKRTGYDVAGRSIANGVAHRRWT
jgi:hypothetical protein